MEPNSTRKYLLYALGEILLVVIGIMIALQVNNWNENSRNIKEGQRLKETLYEELLTVQQYNEQIRADEFDVQISAINDFLNLDQMEQIDSFMAQHEGYWAVKLLSLHTYMISFTSFYTPNFKLYKAAINDGTISLIDDKVLEFLAHKITSNIRELEGALKRLHAYFSFTNDGVTLENVRRVLGDEDPGGEARWRESRER